MESKKGKSVTTSVPSISIKFHANAEQIEELRLSDDDAPNSEEKNSHMASVNPTSSASDHETSPLKLFPKLVKRSTSVDVSAQGLSSSPPSDPWRFFTDIKKSVEEKITEIKARHEEGSPSHKTKTELKAHRESKSEKFSNNKDSSSFSDSEEQSESSISKTCGFISTTEGVEMSSDDETPSIDKEKKVHSSPNVIRQRFRFLKSHSQKYPVKEGTININNLSRLYNINTENVEQALPEHTEDVESAVDALEETDFKRESPERAEKGVGHEEIINKVAQKISNIEVDQDNIVTVKEISGQDIAKNFFSGEKAMSTVFAPTGFVDVRTARQSGNDANVVPYILLSIYIVLYAILHTFTPYLAGMVLGASLALILGYIYIKLYTATVTTAGTNTTLGGVTNRIMEIPAVKEYQPLTKHEGWLNEYPDSYHPGRYHISQTQSVFVRLQGNLLRISHSKSKVPKRAMWNENEIKASFGHHRIYNLLHAKVTLLPEGLTKIRLWSKKYPICISLSKEQMNFDPTVLKMEMEEEKEEKNSDKVKSPVSKKKFTFKKREYPYMAQRFSQLTLDQDIDLDSDSRASTPSPEISDLMQDEAASPQIQEDEKQVDDDDMHSLPDDWSDASQNVSTKSFKSVNKSPARHHSSAHSLDDLKNDSPSEIKLYLFGRTDREKEDWFRRFAAATHHTEEIVTSGVDIDTKETDSFNETNRIEMEYMKYMTLFNKPSRKKSKQDKLDRDSEISQNSEEAEEARSDVHLWFNAIVGRVLFDCMRDPGFTKKVQNRIQKKLQTIKLPYFIEEITITELNLGKTPPFIWKSGKPVLDDRGLWVDLDISYEGLVVLTLQTKINLMKLKNPQLNDKPSLEIKSAIYHSDVDDSAESSSDEEGPQEIPIPKEGGSAAPPPSHGSKKFIKMVDRITESKLFQKATENRYIKKAMEGVSNTELRLTVEIKALSGTVVLNVPPPPSDRIWVGFRPVPELILTACPIVGDRNVTYAMVTSWIEKKLLQEFQKVMVIPNMEDFVVPVMDPKLPE